MTKMESVAQRKKIQKTFEDVRSVSFNEKRSTFLNEQEINSFLDKINSFKEDLIAKTDRIDNINERLENLSWFTDLDDDSLMLLNDLISVAKDLRMTLVRQYVKMTVIRKKGIANKEIKEFKSSIDDLKEICEDLESVFFSLPKMPEFKETTKLLSLVS